MKEGESRWGSETNNASQLLATLTVYHGDAQKEECHTEQQTWICPHNTCPRFKCSGKLKMWPSDIFLLGDAAAGQHCSKAVTRLQNIYLHVFHYTFFFSMFSSQCHSTPFLLILSKGSHSLWVLLTHNCSVKSRHKNHQDTKFAGEGLMF